MIVPLRVRQALALGLLACVVALPGLASGDPVAAEALWTHAERTAGAELTADVYVDAARELSRVRPWQVGYREARLRIARVAEARRGAL